MKTIITIIASVVSSIAVLILIWMRKRIFEWGQRKMSKYRCIRCGKRPPKWFGYLRHRYHKNVINPEEYEFKCAKCWDYTIPKYPPSILAIWKRSERKRLYKLTEGIRNGSVPISEKPESEKTAEDKILDIREASEHRKRLMKIIKENQYEPPRTGFSS